MLEPCAVHHKIYAENTHDGITLYTTFRPAFATTVDHRLPWARCPIAPTSHSSHPKQILSPGHFPDHCHRGRHKTHPRCIEKHVVPRHLQTFSPKTTHPIPSVLGHSLSLSPVPEPAYGALGIGACGPRRGRAQAGLYPRVCVKTAAALSLYSSREKVPYKSELPHQQAATLFCHKPPAGTSFFEYSTFF